MQWSFVNSSDTIATYNTSMLYKVESGGIRGEVPLSIEQRTQVDSYLSNFDLNGVDVRWVDDRNLNTAYGICLVKKCCKLAQMWCQGMLA